MTSPAARCGSFLAVGERWRVRLPEGEPSQLAVGEVQILEVIGDEERQRGIEDVVAAEMEDSDRRTLLWISLLHKLLVTDRRLRLFVDFWWTRLKESDRSLLPPQTSVSQGLRSARARNSQCE